MTASARPWWLTVRQAPRSRAAADIDRGCLQRQGTMALRRTREGLTVEAVKPRGLDRPWAPTIAGDTDAEATLLFTPQPTAPRHATPADADLQPDD
jgi:competence protein ComEC